MSKLESYKKELTLSLDIYDTPAELQGPKAWAQLIVNLLYMKPGSYPSCPEMGIDLSSYDHEFFDNVRYKLQNEVIAQVYLYYPEIPLSSFSITSRLVPGFSQPIVYITLNFTYNDKNLTSVVATTKENHIIDFAIAV